MLTARAFLVDRSREREAATPLVLHQRTYPPEGLLNEEIARAL